MQQGHATRIVQRGNAAMQKGKDTPCRLLIEFAQLADGGAVKLDLPGHRPRLLVSVSIDDYSTWRAVRFADRDETG